MVIFGGIISVFGTNLILYIIIKTKFNTRVYLSAGAILAFMCAGIIV